MTDIELDVYGKPCMVKRDDFECFSDYLYFQLWYREICADCREKVAVTEDDTEMKHIEFCKASWHKSSDGMKVLRLSWQQSLPRCFASKNPVILSRSDPFMDAWITLPIHRMHAQYLARIQPKQVPREQRFFLSTCARGH